MTFDGPVTFDLGGPEALERRLTAIASARREAARVRARIRAVEGELEELEVELREANERVSAEEDDVRRLQSFTLRGILADLRGQKGAELEREVAEVATARHAVVTLQDRQLAVVADLEGLQDRLVALGDLDAEWDDAVAAKARWVDEGDGDSMRRADLAEALGDSEDELRECDEARTAAVDALACLDDVADHLGDESDWADGADDDRLDALCGSVRVAENAIRRLAAELEDVEVALDGGSRAVVMRWDRAFEGFLAGVVTDDALDRRVAEAAAVVDLARVRVGRIAEDVEARAVELGRRVAELREERAALGAQPSVAPQHGDVDSVEM